jgi:hypothetical protein
MVGDNGRRIDVLGPLVWAVIMIAIASAVGSDRSWLGWAERRMASASSSSPAETNSQRNEPRPPRRYTHFVLLAEARAVNYDKFNPSLADITFPVGEPSWQLSTRQPPRPPPQRDHVPRQHPTGRLLRSAIGETRPARGPAVR